MIGSLKEFEQHRKKHGYEKPEVFGHPVFQSLITRIGGSVLSGLLLALAFPGWEHFSLAFIGLVPLMFAVQSVSLKRAAWLGLLCGMVFFMSSLSWMCRMTGTVDSVGMKISAVFSYLVLSLYCALYFVPFAVATALGVQRKWVGDNLRLNLRFMFAAMAIWVGAEYLRGILFTGFPWNPLGVSQYRIPTLIQVASWGGVAFISALAVWMNAALFVTFRQYTHGTRTRKYRAHLELMIGLAPIALCLAGGLRILMKMPQHGEAVNVALIQPNIPQKTKWDPAMAAEINRRLNELTSAATRLPGVDLVIWPESAIPEILYSSIGFSHSPETKALIDVGVPLLAGVNYCDVATTNLYNSSVLMDNYSVISGIYHKQHLVPFGEYVPIPGVKKFTAVSWENTPGDESTILSLPELRPFSVLICFEDIVAPLARNAVQSGARWLVNQTNDGWFDPSAQSEQHMAHAVFRCVENRVPMARCCNTGVSCVIDAYGGVERVLDARSEGFTVATLMPQPERFSSTFYTRHGDLFARVCTLAGAVAFYFLLTGGRRRRKKAD